MARMKRSFIKRNSFWLLIIIVLFFAFTWIILDQEAKINSMKAELQTYKESRQEFMEIMNDLQKKVDVLDTDASKESLAREKLNMIRTDEILYIIKFQEKYEENE